ncbi:MAG: DHH family phosphoesterase [archaeon]|nr:DHH family phosphoesterase [archaeon]
MDVEKLESLAAKVSEPISRETGKIHVVSHFDADGICAGSIAYHGLKLLGKDFDIEFVKQLEEDELKRISESSADLFLFTDLGSGQLDNIRKYIPDKVIVISDHHEPHGDAWDNLYHLNCHLAGFDGKDEISGAGVTYFLMKHMTDKVSSMIYLALVGAAGDVQKKDGVFKSVNNHLLDEALKIDAITVKKGLRLFGRSTRPLHRALRYANEIDLPFADDESKCIQFLSNLGIPMKNGSNDWITLSDLTCEQEKKLATAIIMNSDVTSNKNNIVGNVFIIPTKHEIREFATMLNSCGRMGKSIEGLKLCLGMIDDIEHIQKAYRRKIASYLNLVKKNDSMIRKTEYVSYIIARDKIEDNFIGTILSILSNSFFDTKISFAFANSYNGVKVSSRADRSLEGKINLKEIVSKVVEVTGGEGGGHSLASGAKIPSGSEELFISEVEKHVCEQMQDA